MNDFVYQRRCHVNRACILNDRQCPISHRTGPEIGDRKTDMLNVIRVLSPSAFPSSSSPRSLLAPSIERRRIGELFIFMNFATLRRDLYIVACTCSVMYVRTYEGKKFLNPFPLLFLSDCREC